jgi:hypothetical protein
MMPPVMAVMPMMMAVAPMIAVAVVPVSVVTIVAMAPVTVVPPMPPVADAVDEPARLTGRWHRRRRGAGTCGHAAQAEHCGANSQSKDTHSDLRVAFRVIVNAREWLVFPNLAA